MRIHYKYGLSVAYSIYFNRYFYKIYEPLIAQIITRTDKLFLFVTLHEVDDGLFAQEMVRENFSLGLDGEVSSLS